MKSYRFTRDLDGAADGETRKMSIDDATPLLASGAIVEAGEPVAASDPEPAQPVQTVDAPVAAAAHRGRNNRQGAN